MKFLNNAYKYSYEGIIDGVYQFKFLSEGEIDITKIVSLSPINEENVYNLGFGNLELLDNEYKVNDKPKIRSQVAIYDYYLDKLKN